jgi:O-antigen/teichoic acid export membrane protein
VASVLAGTLIANIVIGVPASLWLLSRTGIRPDRAIWRELVRFGVPYQIGQIAMFVLAFGDRYFLQAARGLSSVGIYSLAYQFGFFLSTLGAESFLQAWSPQMFRFISFPRESREPRYNEGLWILSLVMTTLCVGIALFSRAALRILAGPAYQGAADLVPLICLCYVVQAWTALMHFGIDVSGQTRYSSYANWIAAGVIVVLYAVFIPAFGGWGAAFATLLGFLARFALTAYWSHKLWPISYEWRPSLMMAGLAIITMAFGTLLRTLGLFSLLIGSSVLSLLFLAAVWTFVAGDEMRQRMRAFLARTFCVARTALTRA